MKKHKFLGLTRRISKELLSLYFLDLRNSILSIKSKLAIEIALCDRALDLENMRPSIIRERLSRGDRIFVAYHRSKPVAYLFTTTTECWVSEIEDNLIIGLDEIYLYDAYTRAEYRGNRIYSCLITSAAQFFKKLSYSNALIFATNSNILSAKGIERSNFYCYQTIHFYNLFGLRSWDYSKRNKLIQSRFSNEI